MERQLETYQKIERSIIKKFRKQLWTPFIVAVKRYELIQAGHWLFLTRDTHPDNYLATREGRHLPVEHCIEGEDGWNFAPELENALDGTEPEVCHIVNKPTFGSYMLPSEILDELMAHNKAVDDIEKIVIYGYCTDICVISNAMVLRAAFPETEIEILSDCCAGVTPQSHQTALDAMRACQFTIV